MVVLEQAAKKLWNLGEPIHTFAVCSNLGLVELRRNQIDRAMYYFTKAVNLGRKGLINDKIDMIWMNIGICAVLSGDVYKAEQAFSKAATKMKKIGSIRSLAILYANWGKLKMLQSDIPMASRFVEHATKLCVHHPHPITEHTIAMLQVALFLRKNNIAKALSFWREAYEIVDVNQYTFKRVETLCFGVEIFARMGNFDRSQDLFFDAKDVTSKSTVDSFWLCYAQAQFSKYKQNQAMYANSFRRAQELIRNHFPKRLDIQYFFDRLRYAMDD